VVFSFVEVYIDGPPQIERRTVRRYESSFPAIVRAPAFGWPESERKTEVMNLLKRLWEEEEGQDLIEYALIMVLIALAATAGMNSLAMKINTMFTNFATILSSAT
jgi:pilus assembly protein Flp/PilA